MSSDLSKIIDLYLAGSDDQKKQLKEFTISLIENSSNDTEIENKSTYVSPAPQIVVHIPEGTMCSIHINRSASKSCDKCREYYCASCLYYVRAYSWCGQSKNVCRKCKNKIESSNSDVNCCLCFTILIICALILGIIFL